MNESYKLPTNFELVQKAKVIVLARIESVPADMESGGQGTPNELVSLRPLRFLKGSAAPGALALMGSRSPKNWQGVSAATTLWQSHFSAGLGACVRQFYEPGELVVAIFDDDPRAKKISGKDFSQIFDPWARVVETIDGPNDIWVKAVERYAALQSGDPAKTKQRIEAEIQHLRSIATPEAQAIAADLEYHLRRGDRAGTWGNFSMPKLTAASVPGQTGAQLSCVAGTPPSLILAVGPSPNPPTIFVDGVAHPTMAAELTPVERAMLAPRRRLGGDSERGEPRFLYRLTTPSTLRALQTATKNVSVDVEGKPIVSGQPLDALLRWVSQCEKLQKLPAPTEDELGQPNK